MDLKIYPPEEMVEATLDLPLSKSICVRALLMDSLSGHDAHTVPQGICDDTDAMRAALASELSGTKNIGAAGTAMRFLTAYYAATPGADVVIDGSERMRQRPIGLLVDALRELGADIAYTEREGFPPLRIRGAKLRGGELDIDASVSSQYISALLMAAPSFSSPLTIHLKGKLASLPYLDMTLAMMRHRGIEAERTHTTIEVRPGEYSPSGVQDIERDWSAASYWYALAALSSGWVTLPSLTLPSLQGDSKVASIFEKLGVITTVTDSGIELSASPEVFSRLDEDLSDTPDIVQTLVVTCCLLGVPFYFSGVKSLKIKETDRIEALIKEADKLGCILETAGDDVIKWDGKRHPIFSVPEIDTYSDHRMAMAFAIAAVYLPEIVIKDAEVVTKSYPAFWDNLRAAGLIITDAASSALPTDTTEP